MENIIKTDVKHTERVTAGHYSLSCFIIIYYFFFFSKEKDGLRPTTLERDVFFESRDDKAFPSSFPLRKVLQ